MADAEPIGALKQAVDRLEKGGVRGREWIDKVRKDSSSVNNEALSLIETTRRARLAARRTGSAVHRRNCVGVFGPSQAGKSYLVSALARPKDKPLKIDFGGDVKDFLKDINPAGDRESTGLVSRFTRHAMEPDREYPVEVHLLRETDLVKILANCFLCDFDPNNMSIEPPNEQEIRDTFCEAESQAGSAKPGASHLDEIELFDLGEYFRRHFRNRVGALDRADYWNKLIDTAARLPIERRARLFAILWGGLEPLTELFILLATALESIGNPPEARVAISGLIPRETGDPPRPNTIVDVAVLNRLNSTEDTRDTLGLKPLGPDGPGQPTELPRAVLTALIAEVKLVMVDAPWPFFEHTDLLDFPGARSRLKLTHLPADQDGDEQQVRELFLRGKIAYLFQRYTDELELSAMLLCMPPSVQEVKDLAGMVRSWIETTHGKTSESRRKQTSNTLFLVLTKFDLEFLEKGGETRESRQGKWDRRLHSSFLELYGKDGWPEDWDGKPFANSVFLRNPGMRQVHLMDYEDEGSLVEVGVKTSDVIGGYQDAYMNSALVEKHFRDRSAVWTAAMQPNDGGVEYLVGRLSQVLNPKLKRQQGAEQLLLAVRDLKSALGRFYHSQGDEAREARDHHLQNVRRALFKSVKLQEYRSFAHFLEALLLPTIDARNVFFNVAAMREEQIYEHLNAGEADPRAEFADDPRADHDPWNEESSSDDGPAPDVTLASARRRERPEIFAEQVINVWTARLRTLQKDTDMLGVLELSAKNMVNDIVDDIITGADRHGLRNRIADAVREETSAVGARWEDMVERAVRIAVYEINDYVSYLGFGTMAESERPSHQNRAIFSLDTTNAQELEIGPMRKSLETIFFFDWGVAFRKLGMDNIAHASGREISDEHNRELGRILHTIDLEDTLRATK